MMGGVVLSLCSSNTIRRKRYDFLMEFVGVRSALLSNRKKTGEPDKKNPDNISDIRVYVPLEPALAL
ncbi:MAG: hypothetical protein EBR93_01145 [Bacteroidetes bacterium]|nr:hypothetical protein [Bacteroidota bacterium]